MAAIKSRCKLDYFPAFRKSGRRSVQDIKWIVMHATASTASAEKIARYFHGTAAKGSAHLVVDDYVCFRCLMDQDIPWGAPGANTNGFHIEQVGLATWSEAEWMKHKPTLERAAYKAAYHCHKFNIPPRFIGTFRLRLGMKGITTHALVSQTFPGNAHWDPGAGWPKKFFMSRVKAYYAEIAAEKKA